MPPKLSIQITLHNRAEFIRASVISALNCGYRDSEIIIFDDASSDGSGKEAARLSAEYPGRIRYMRSDENIGCARARAAMVRETASEYILPFDDDDILLPFDIAGQIELLDKNPGFAVSYGKIFLTDERLKPLGAAMGGSYSRFLLSYGTQITHSSSIIRRSDILEAGNYKLAGNTPKPVAEDLYLWFELSLKKDFFFDNAFRMLYRQHPSQATSRKDAYLEAANFIHNKTIDGNRDIYERIISGKIDIAPHEIKTVTLMLSIISRYLDHSLPRRLRILNTAETIAPGDYGVNVVKFEHFLEFGNYAAALAEADKILNRPDADIYIRKLALEKILRVCEKNGADTAEIKKQIGFLAAEFMKFDFARIPVE